MAITILLSVIPILLIIILVCFEYRYFHNEKLMCNSYGIFDLRDGLIFEMISEDRVETLESTYADINRLVPRSKKLNYKLITSAMNAYLDKLIESINWNDGTVDIHYNKKLNKYDEKLIKLMIITAKKNCTIASILLSKAGMFFLRYSLLVKAIIRIMKILPTKNTSKIDTSLKLYALNTKLRYSS